MLKRHKYVVFVVIFFTLLSILFYRKYVFDGLVPFPSNLLVSFYSPWKLEGQEGYLNGPANKPIGFDVLKLFYPYRKYTQDRLINGEFPLWNPYVFSGNVHLATYQSAVFYPLNIVYFLVPLIDAWSLLVMVQPILAGYFTFLFLRLIRLSFKSSIFGSVVFAFSPWMIAWSEESLVIEHSALWLPLVLYGVENLFQKKNNRGVLLIISGLTLSILAGFLQMTIYAGLFSFSYLFYRYFQERKKNIRVIYYFIFASIVSLLICAIHVLPALESYFYSPRGVVNVKFIFDTYLMMPWHLLTFIVPDFWGNPGAYNYFGGGGFYHEKIIFIGIPAFLLSVYTIFNSSIRLSTSSFFKYASVITLLLGFFPFGWISYYISLPVISTMVPSRIFFLSSFSLAVIASFGMEYLLHGKMKFSLMRKILVLIGVILGFMWIFVLIVKYVKAVQLAIDPKSYIAITSFRNLFIPTMLFVLCTLLFTIFKKWKNKVNAYYYIFIILNMFSSLYFAHKFLYFSERKFVFPETSVISKVKELAGIDRVWAYGNGYIEKNMLSYFNIYSPEGYDALYSQKYGELMHAQETKGIYTNQISRTDAGIRQSYEKESITKDPFRMRLLSLLGVRYIIESKKGDGKGLLTTEERFPSNLFQPAWQDDNFRIWEYKSALPRIFMAHDFKVENDSQTIFSNLFDSRFDLRKTLILEKEPDIQPCDQEFRSNLSIENYSPEKITIKTSSICDGLLFISDTYYPGWISKVDSKKVPILRADYAFRAIPIQKGQHLVEFLYEPISVRLGSYISIVTVLLFYPLYIIFKRYV